jgi:hypothetical protein
MHCFSIPDNEGTAIRRNVGEHPVTQPDVRNNENVDSTAGKSRNLLPFSAMTYPSMSNSKRRRAVHCFPLSGAIYLHP